MLFRSAWKENLGRCPAPLVSRERSNHDVAVPDEGGCDVLRLFPIGLLEFGTINVFEIDRLASPIVTDRQTIALMDSDDSRGKVGP